MRAARELGLPALTLYAFSEQNWGRPADEVARLMELLATFLHDEVPEILERGVALHSIGDDTRLPRAARDAWPVAKWLRGQPGSAAVPGAVLRRARGDRAAARTLARRRPPACAQAIDEAMFAAALDTTCCRRWTWWSAPAGEQRLSNFLLWEAAYAELPSPTSCGPTSGARSWKGR